MGSGASTAKRRTSHNRELGLRFQHQIEMSKAQPRKSFLNRIIHYGSASERSKERWETLSSDFTGNQPKKIRSVLFERQLSTLGPTQRQLHLAQTQDENLVGKSMERDDFGYDPLLVFELDCKSLAAVVMQRLIRGHLIRARYTAQVQKTVVRLGEIENRRHQQEIEQKERNERNEPNTLTQNKQKTTMLPHHSDSVSIPSSPSSTTHTTTITDKHFEHHDQMTEMFKQKAIAAKRAGDVRSALQHMQKYKILQTFTPTAVAAAVAAAAVVDQPTATEVSASMPLTTTTATLPSMPLTPLTPSTPSTPSSTPPSSTSPTFAASPFLIQTINEGSLHLVEEYKQKAISARKNGDTQLAIQYMIKYKSLNASLKDESRLEISSPSSSSNGQIEYEHQRKNLSVQIETAKQTAMGLKRRGEITEALSKMKLYKSLLAQQTALDNEQELIKSGKKRRSPNLPS